MSIERARTHLEALGLDDRIMEFEQSSATVELAAAAVGCEPARIAKTMAFLLPDGAPALIVTAGDRRVDNAKYKAFFGAKAKMLTAEQLRELVGHDPGGVCPFAVKPGCRTYLDISLRRFDVVYPAAGDAASAVALTLPELERFSASRGWIDVCK